MSSKKKRPQPRTTKRNRATRPIKKAQATEAALYYEQLLEQGYTSALERADDRQLKLWQ